ncbi:MAG TPA: hypothetical protein VF725_09355 [Ktedonobacterales bacterium]
MGLSDLPIWGQIAGILFNDGMDHLGAKKCATKGHIWRNVDLQVLRDDGGLDIQKDGAQRCGRCGATRPLPEE